MHDKTTEQPQKDGLSDRGDWNTYAQSVSGNFQIGGGSLKYQEKHNNFFNIEKTPQSQNVITDETSLDLVAKKKKNNKVAPDKQVKTSSDQEMSFNAPTALQQGSDRVATVEEIGCVIGQLADEKEQLLSQLKEIDEQTDVLSRSIIEEDEDNNPHNE